MKPIKRTQAAQFKNVAFQQGGSIIRLHDSLIRRALPSFNPARHLFIEPFYKHSKHGQAIVLRPRQESKAVSRKARSVQQRLLLSAYRSQPQGRCFYIASVSILRALSLNRDEVAGLEFPTEVSAGTIIVTMERSSSKSRSAK